MAEQFSVISEHIAVNPRDAVRDEFLLWCLIGPVIVGFLCLCAWIDGGIPVSGGLFVGILVTFIALPLRALGAYHKARRVSGRVTVEDGWVTIQHPVYGKAAWALHECRWHLGKAREAGTFFPRLYLRRKVVIVECPVTVRFLRWMREKIPCGLTEETRDVWEAFLAFGEVERKSRPGWWPSRKWSL